MTRREIDRLYPEMPERGKRQVLLHEKWIASKEARDDHTRQRQFERGFRHADMPRFDGRGRDYAFRKRDVNRIVNAIDARFDDARREMRWQKAMDALADWPTLQKTLQAIRDYRERPLIVEKLGISENSYRLRFFRVTKILKRALVI